MKNLRELVIAVLVIAVAYMAWDASKLRDKASDYQKRETVLNRRYDSIQVLQVKADLEALRVMTDFNVLLAEFKAQGEVSRKYIKRYEKLKNTPIPHLSDAAIDSALSRLYKNR